MKSHRLARVSEVVRETAATAILFNIKDPRVKNVTVTRAEVSADLQHAKIYVSVMGSEREQQLTMHGLKSAAGYIQTKVAERLTTRYVPHVTFVLDDGIKKSVEIARMIREENERIAADHAAAGIVDDVAAAAATDDEDEGDEEGDEDEGEETHEAESGTAPPEQAKQPGPAEGSSERPS